MRYLPMCKDQDPKGERKGKKINEIMQAIFGRGSSGRVLGPLEPLRGPEFPRGPRNFEKGPRSGPLEVPLASGP